MAGSFSHCKNDDGTFRFDLIENMNDAYQACEDMFWMIMVLAEEANMGSADLDKLETEVIRGRRPGKPADWTDDDPRDTPELEQRVKYLENFVREAINAESMDIDQPLTMAESICDPDHVKTAEDVAIETGIMRALGAEPVTAVPAIVEAPTGSTILEALQNASSELVSEKRIPMWYRWEERDDGVWLCRPPGSSVLCATVYQTGNWCINAPDPVSSPSTLIKTTRDIGTAKLAAVAACKVSGWWRAEEKPQIDYTKCGLDANRYSVVWDDGEPASPDARFFVLRYDKNDVWGYRCRVALIDFAAAIADDYPLLSEQLRADVTKYEGFAIKAPSDSPQVFTCPVIGPSPEPAQEFAPTDTRLEVNEVARASLESMGPSTFKKSFSLLLKDGRMFKFGKILFVEIRELKMAGAVEIEIERIEAKGVRGPDTRGVYRVTGYDEGGEIVKLGPDDSEDDDS